MQDFYQRIFINIVLTFAKTGKCTQILKKKTYSYHIDDFFNSQKFVNIDTVKKILLMKGKTHEQRNFKRRERNAKRSF